MPRRSSSASAGVLAAGLVLCLLPSSAATAAERPAVREGDRGVLLDGPGLRGTLRVRVPARGAGGRTAPEGPALRTGEGWAPARSARTRRLPEGGLDVRMRTTDAVRGLRLRVRPRDDGRVDLELRATGRSAGVTGVSLGVGLRRGERITGTGQRSDAVQQRGRDVLARVEEGPYVAGDEPVVAGSVPAWARREGGRSSAFPMPWVLSDRGYGLLVREDTTSRLRLGSTVGDRMTVETEGPRMRASLLTGTTPAALLGSLTRITGRQPPTRAAWQWGTWFQSGHRNVEPDEVRRIDELRAAGVPISAIETHMRYMPCRADAGQEGAERARTAAAHARGLAIVGYLREAVCTSDREYARGAREGAFTRRADGSPYVYAAFAGAGPIDLAQVDPTAPAGRAMLARLYGRLLGNGYDGWMEDYGEYTPPDAVAADGSTGEAAHNRYPVLYHREARRIADRQRRGVVRFQRSGWTGAQRDAQVVWGGDPTTDWGFDGLRSSVTQALSMGLSGVGVWGSDVGGFFTITGPSLTPELLKRWIQFGAVSGVMRTKAAGVATARETRPQVWEPEILPTFRRYARLRTQLLPYVQATAAAYRRTGVPMMRHMSLLAPRERDVAGREDQFGFGPDLLAAPVVRPGQRLRTVALPRGGWVDLGPALTQAGEDGALRLGRARTVRGGRRVEVAAPLERLPLLARAGTVLPLSSAEVDTLAPHGGRGVTRLADRADRLGLVAVPHGTRGARFGEDGAGRLLGRESRAGWRLDVRAPQTMRARLQASLRTLRTPMRACGVRVDGRALPRSRWTVDASTGVLRADLGRLRTSRVLVERC